MLIVLEDNINLCVNVILVSLEIPMLNVDNVMNHVPNVQRIPIVHHVSPASMNDVKIHVQNLTFVVPIKRVSYLIHIHYELLRVDVQVI